jgi:hypothetical protein
MPYQYGPVALRMRRSVLEEGERRARGLRAWEDSMVSMRFIEDRGAPYFGYNSYSDSWK